MKVKNKNAVQKTAVEKLIKAVETSFLDHEKALRSERIKRGIKRKRELDTKK